jgi:hypothetical protein
MGWVIMSDFSVGCPYPPVLLGGADFDPIL